jgi:VWFA-related protein
MALKILLVAILAAQEPAFRLPVRLVSAPALVFSGDNRLLPNLQPPDFELLDNGHPQAFSLNATPAPVSLVLAIQVNRDVRSYVPFLAKTGSAVDALLVGETGESAVLTYADEVRVVKEFGERDVQTALRGIAAGGRSSRMLDAGARAAGMLAQRDRRRMRVLLFIGQPGDTGSESDVASLRQSLEKEGIAVFALALPLAGRAFVSDTFSLNGVTFAERGGFRAGTDFGKLVSVLHQGASAAAAGDPFALLTAATGGTQLHFRTQRQLEDGLGDVGVQLRSGYTLTYYPRPADTGYHTIGIKVNVPGAKVHARPGYWLSPE